MLLSGMKAVNIPKRDSTIKFTSLPKIVPVPFVIYDDLEHYLFQYKTTPNHGTSYTLKTHKHPDTYYLPELWLVAAQVFEALARHDDARRAARDGHAWVMAVHDAHVAPEFRESFLHRNPVNRELLGLAARWNV